MTSPTFTSDWHTASAVLGPGRWDRHVLPLLRRFSPVRWLEIGSHEGRSALWVADNVPQVTVTCVDTWLQPWLNTTVEHIFNTNVEAHKNIVKVKGRSADILPRLSFGYHAVYVDGSHEEEDVYSDASLAMSLVVPGAVLILDDYQHCWSNGDPLAPGTKIEYPGVREAAARLLRERGDELRIVYCGWQLILQVRG